MNKWNPLTKWRMPHFMLDFQSYFKGNQLYFWSMAYPQMLETSGFRNDKAIGVMIRCGMREDAITYIQQKRKGRKAA